MAVDFETSTYGLLVVIMILLVGMCCERYHQSRNTCCKCHRNGTKCKCPGGPTLNALNGFLSTRSGKEGLDADVESRPLRSGNLGGLYGSHAGDAVSEEELYLQRHDNMSDGIDPEVQESHNEYVVEQDIIIGSRGASGAGATETSHYKPPNTPWGLTGFRNYYNDTYTEPNARQMPSDDPGQYYSHNPTGYCFGAN